MAIPVAETPVLRGEDALEFERQIKENERLRNKGVPVL